MIKRKCLVLAASLLLLVLALWAQDGKYQPPVVKTYELSRFGGQVPGPAKSEDFPAWLADIKHWRHERLIRMGYDGSEYARPELAWTQRSFIQSMVIVHERYLYDPTKGEYTVNRFLDDLEERYGGVDNVILWHGYPNVGIDNRNQYDLFRDLPGGIPGLRKMVGDFHRRGVRVLFPEVPWDQGTRSEGEPDWEALTRLLAQVEADGIYGDTFNAVPLAWHVAAEQLGHPLVLEPQNALLTEQLAWNLMTHGEGWQYSFVPIVSHHKWLEPRHMVHLVRRRARDRTDELQHAFFNGIGYLSWENIWGSWNGITARDAQALRRIAKMERKFADLLVSSEWEPHTPTLRYGVFASKFPGGTQTLWTFINRNEYGVTGRQISIPHTAGTRYYDLWHGEELEPELSSGVVVLSFDLEPKGYGAVLSLEANSEAGKLKQFLEEMHELARQPLSSFATEWSFLPQRLVDIARTEPAETAPPGMILIPSGDFEFRVSGVEVEGRNYVGVDVQYSWEDSPRRHHRSKLPIKSFYIDRYPVTNAEFKKFLDAAGYHPKDDHNFLKHWEDGTYPEGWGNKPVIWVSLEDARAYAVWAGKRLPTEWEWQYAAQGTDGRLYPWGNEWDPTAVPPVEKGREIRGPTDVDAFPRGASPFGVMDMVGNVWQWTNEFTDEHTRAAILRGGSYYQAQGSRWYFPQAYQLDQHGKYLLMSPGRDRAGTIGFRCLADAE